MIEGLSIDPRRGILWMQEIDVVTRPLTVELALQAKTGNPVAFDRLMELEQARVFRIAGKLLVQRDDAADAVQEVFLRLYRHIEKYDPTQQWDGWVYRICVNACRDINRKRRWREMLSLDAWLDSDQRTPVTTAQADEIALSNQRKQLIEEGLRQLPEQERAALVLRDIEGLSAAEAAQALGTRESTVRSQACRARVRLREFLISRTGGGRM